MSQTRRSSLLASLCVLALMYELWSPAFLSSSVQVSSAAPGTMSQPMAGGPIAGSHQELAATRQVNSLVPRKFLGGSEPPPKKVEKPVKGPPMWLISVALLGFAGYYFVANSN
eukprot:TRINITY_DN6267_c0_g1_i1.p1 TRINITY_DN6267_c0_g1~~TRINITY_DN6267_c0_g1_i1.p1  ORF type:complete len:113 (-),score=19.19 TRINITY_DN6267_c0_g1_i1:113-451(-)